MDKLHKTKMLISNIIFNIVLAEPMGNRAEGRAIIIEKRKDKIIIISKDIIMVFESPKNFKFLKIIEFRKEAR
jgi:hypothetical protein